MQASERARVAALNLFIRFKSLFSVSGNKAKLEWQQSMANAKEQARRERERNNINWFNNKGSRCRKAEHESNWIQSSYKKWAAAKNERMKMHEKCLSHINQDIFLLLHLFFGVVM
jgi:hypothetical protein